MRILLISFLTFIPFAASANDFVFGCKYAQTVLPMVVREIPEALDGYKAPKNALKKACESRYEYLKKSRLLKKDLITQGCHHGLGIISRITGLQGSVVDNKMLPSDDTVYILDTCETLARNAMKNAKEVSKKNR